MLDLAKLLILDGRPSKEMIDYLVDNSIKEIVDKAYGVMDRASVDGNYDLYRLFSVEDRTSQNGLVKVGCHGKYYEEVRDELEQSISRYQPFVTFNNDEHRKPKDFWGKIKNNPKEIVLLVYPLSLEITPQMKKSLRLKNELGSNLSEKNCSTNIKIKI